MRPNPLVLSQTTIGVASPASAVKDASTFEGGISYLNSIGLRVKTGRTLFASEGYLSGDDATRAFEFNTFLRDPEIGAIFCARGGYGTLRILPLLDYDAARSSPKLIVGYSDITALQLAMFTETGLSSISGPMVSTEWFDIDPESERLFLELAQGHIPAPLLGPHGTPLRGLRGGQVTGVLLGGNLSILCRLIGTSYMPSLEGAILFIEDVGETPHRIDGMLAQLKLAGIWDLLGGLVIGMFTKEDSPDHTPTSIQKVFLDYCVQAPFPVATGLIYGHIPTKNALPIGVNARLEVSGSQASLSILEPVVTL